MIARLHGIICKETPGDVTVDVHGVGYRVTVPVTVWDDLEEAAVAQLWISTYVREDRLELFGFTDRRTRSLFEKLIDISGVGPRMALELCAAPKHMLLEAADTRDGKQLTSIKGIGRKTADKLAIELAGMAENNPGLFVDEGGGMSRAAIRDPDAVAALSQLGYPNSDILRALEKLPKELTTTEERVAAALKEL